MKYSIKFEFYLNFSIETIHCKFEISINSQDIRIRDKLSPKIGDIKLNELVM